MYALWQGFRDALSYLFDVGASNPNSDSAPEVVDLESRELVDPCDLESGLSSQGAKGSDQKKGLQVPIPKRSVPELRSVNLLAGNLHAAYSPCRTDGNALDSDQKHAFTSAPHIPRQDAPLFVRVIQVQFLEGISQPQIVGVQSAGRASEIAYTTSSHNDPVLRASTRISEAAAVVAANKKDLRYTPQRSAISQMSTSRRGRGFVHSGADVHCLENIFSGCSIHVSLADTGEMPHSSGLQEILDNSQNVFNESAAVEHDLCARWLRPEWKRRSDLTEHQFCFSVIKINSDSDCSYDLLGQANVNLHPVIRDADLATAFACELWVPMVASKQYADYLGARILVQVFIDAPANEIGSSGRIVANSDDIAEKFESTIARVAPEFDSYGLPLSSASIRRLYANFPSYAREVSVVQQNMWCFVHPSNLLRKYPPGPFAHQNMNNRDEHPVEQIDLRIADLMLRVGVPSDRRSAVYMLVSGAALKARREGSEYYRLLCLRSSTPGGLHQVDSMQIELDIPRTFSRRSTPFGEDLGRMLRAYASRNRAVGYCQGMNVLAARCLMVTNHEEDAFWLLASLCEDIFPGYFVPSMTGTMADVRVVQDLLRSRLPRIKNHARRLGVPLDGIISQWLLTLFAGGGHNSPPSFTVFRVWDALMLLGSNMLVVLSFMIFQISSEQLMASRSASAFLNTLSTSLREMTNPDLWIMQSARIIDELGHAQLESARYHSTREVSADAEQRLRRKLKRKFDLLDQVAFDELCAHFYQAVPKIRIASSYIDHCAMDLPTFRSVIEEFAPEWKRDPSAIDRLFVAFDADHNGVVDIHEFLHGLQAMSQVGSKADKMRLLFLAYDAFGRGTLGWQDLACLMRSIYLIKDQDIDQQAVTATAQALLSVLGSNRLSGTQMDGLTFEEFLQVPDTQPSVLEIMRVRIPFGKGYLKEYFRRMKDSLQNSVKKSGSEQYKEFVSAISDHSEIDKRRRSSLQQTQQHAIARTSPRS